jgi:tRNA modification GTPase
MRISVLFRNDPHRGTTPEFFEKLRLRGLPNIAPSMESTPADAADTIVALSTPPGYSGVGLIRMSGPAAVPILTRVFRTAITGAGFPDRAAVYGRVVDPRTENPIDDGLALVMRGPRSYTGEDTVELSLHGSPVALDLVLRVLLSEGARVASRGEFTRRAFLAGRVDLIQAEAVIDLIEASSPQAVEDARDRLEKGLSIKVRSVSDGLKDLLAALEAHIDFDEDEEEPPPDPVSGLDEVLRAMDALIVSGKEGRVWREGIRCVIAGKPNVGKSTLFNALLGSERAIVTPYPGTTRDCLEDRIMVDGLPIVLWDTAGVRDVPEPVETEGIRRTLLRIGEADVVLLVVDGSQAPDAEDAGLLSACDGKRTVLLLNKADLGLAVSASDPRLGGAPESQRLAVSAKTGQGLEDLRAILADFGKGLMGTAAHRGNLTSRGLIFMEAARVPARELLDRLSSGEPVSAEILSLEIRRSLRLLEEITGERVDEGVLDRIFERFCVGK